MKPDAVPLTFVKGKLGDAFARITPAQRMGILTAVVAAATGLIGVSSIHEPWRRQRANLLAQLAQGQEASNLLAAARNLRTELEKTGSEILLSGGASHLMQEISTLAGPLNIEIASIVPQPEVNVGPYRLFQVELGLQASLPTLVRFLHAAGTHRPLLLVQEMEIGGSLPDIRGNPLGLQGGLPGDRQRIRLRVGAIGWGRGRK